MTVNVEGSSNIRTITYMSGILTVEFITGGKYEYYGVPRDIFNEFANAESKGRYFAANIKGQYESKKL